MYTSPGFKTKKDLKAAVAAGRTVTLFSPGLGTPQQNGTEYVEGPNFQPHSFYAQVTVVNGVVTKVK